MKICYVGKHNDAGNKDEYHVAAGLRSLGHEVILRQQEPRVDIPEGTDLVLANHWYECDLEWLKTVKAFKVIWFWDKVWRQRAVWMAKAEPVFDHIFMSDGTFADGKKKLSVLRQGTGEVVSGIKSDHKADIAFPGSLYGERLDWYMKLKTRYGSRIRHFQGIHGSKLSDLCESVPIILAPPFPSDDNYWSNRIYLILGHGGFLLHPRLEGMDEYTDGVHYVAYDTDLVEKIDYYLENPGLRNTIRILGQEKTQKDYSYTERCRKLIEEIHRLKSTGKKE